MKNEMLAQHLLDHPQNLSASASALSTVEAAELVAYLKSEADRHWWINANHSLRLADMIIQLGQARGDAGQHALGIMARGDALKQLGRIAEGWEALEQAGALFQAAGDMVGWARTRIGRLVISIDLGRVDQALAEAAQARAILLACNEHEKALRVDLNTGIIYSLLGDHQRALRLFETALHSAEKLLAAGQSDNAVLRTNTALLCNSIGYEQHVLGDFRQALRFHQRARTHMVEQAQTSGIVLADLNIAQIAMFQGHHRQALQLLHRAHDLCMAEQLSLDAIHVRRHIVDCYLLLNRYAEARDLARQVAADYQTVQAGFYQALALLQAATAEAELRSFAAAHTALDAAEPIFDALQATTMVATTRLRRARIALHTGDPAAAQHVALQAAAGFGADRQQLDYAAATLLQAQALFATGAHAAATTAGLTALRIAQRSNIPPLRYDAHLLLGRIAEAQGDLLRARRRYHAAVTTVERVQRGLTITLRPSFLEDKSEALRALLALDLRAGRVAPAFESLERTKSQALLGYLANRDQLRWSLDDPRSCALIDELNTLREEHQWFYRLAHTQPTDQETPESVFTPAQARAEVASRERRMRAITEQLYLQSGDQHSAGLAAPTVRDVQRTLDDRTLLIEFYNDGTTMWAFTLDARTAEVYQLPASVQQVDQLLAQLQVNIAAALKAGADSAVAGNLAKLAQRMLARLSGALLDPLAAQIAGKHRLLVVPYGALHYLPFHLLQTGGSYLIERHEVVVLPTAGLATRPAPRCPRGARVLAHAWDGRLAHTETEARMVQQRFGGECYAHTNARRNALSGAPCQILHIAAHGQHRLDQPDLSYIQLADGQLYTDDLLQHDLSYELVVLSACETGRANVTAGDELIGLGRGFLYAGAGALLVSLWRIDDQLALRLMDYFYRDLHAGRSKAAALRAAQRALLADHPQLHPAFWGAFQLVGDAGPLSSEQQSNELEEAWQATDCLQPA